MEMPKGGQSGGGGKSTPMTQTAASRIQSSTAKQHGGGVPKGSFASRAQRAAARNTQQGKYWTVIVIPVDWNFAALLLYFVPAASFVLNPELFDYKLLPVLRVHVLGIAAGISGK